MLVVNLADKTFSKAVVTLELGSIPSTIFVYVYFSNA